jgi:hypothetical protein
MKANTKLLELEIYQLLEKKREENKALLKLIEAIKKADERAGDTRNAPKKK